LGRGGGASQIKGGGRGQQNKSSLLLKGIATKKVGYAGNEPSTFQL